MSGLKTLYAGPVLKQLTQDTLRFKSSKSPLKEFCAIQQEYLQTHLDGFDYDQAATSLIETDSEGVAQSIETYLYQFDFPDTEVLANYEACVEDDHVSKLIFLNPGWALSHKDVFLSPVENEPFYKKHASRYGFSKSYSIGFQVPLFDGDWAFLSFDYLGNAQNKTWDHFDHQKLEWATFPFALCWLYLTGRIGRKTLSNHLIAVSDLTVGQLEKLTIFVHHQDKPFEELGGILNVGEAHMRKSFMEIKERILNQFSYDAPPNRRTKLATILPYCQLLKMMRDRSKPFQTIKGRPMPSYFHDRVGHAYLVAAE